MGMPALETVCTSFIERHSDHAHGEKIHGIPTSYFPKITGSHWSTRQALGFPHTIAVAL